MSSSNEGAITARTRYVDVNGRRLAYRSVGAGKPSRLAATRVARGCEWCLHKAVALLSEHHFDRLSDAVTYAMHLRNHLPTMRLFVVLRCGAASALP
jgi:hypothetical protein